VTPQSVRTRGEHIDPAGAVNERETDEGALAPADPVALHDLGFFRPVDPVEPLQQFIREFRDLEKPLFQILAYDLGFAPLAMAPFGLFVGKYRFAGGAPVDRRFLPVSQAVPVEQQE
jgi:hypothetical protein